MSKVVSIAIGADHRGFVGKQALMQCESLPDARALNWHDVGAYDGERSDYPVFAAQALELLIQKKVAYAVLLCGTGIGMAIAANRYREIYAGVLWDEEMARLAREDDNVNVLVFPADFITPEMMRRCFFAWMMASFKGGRYQERLDMIDR
jgi:ribose 5-phosphate isomerase B